MASLELFFLMTNGGTYRGRVLRRQGLGQESPQGCPFCHLTLSSADGPAG